jgi:hypothetical protein
MATLSNSYMQKTLIDEINTIFIEFVEVSKKFIFKHHKIIGYF